MDVIKECTELRVGEFRRDVGDCLNNRIAVQRASAIRRDRSVISRATFEAPTMSPRSFLSGDTVRETFSRAPSLRCRTVS